MTTITPMTMRIVFLCLLNWDIKPDAILEDIMSDDYLVIIIRKQNKCLGIGLDHCKAYLVTHSLTCSLYFAMFFIYS